MIRWLRWPASGGSLLGVLALTATNPDPDAIDASADELAVNLLRMFGLPRDEAREIAAGRCPRRSDSISVAVRDVARREPAVMASLRRDRPAGCHELS